MYHSLLDRHLHYFKSHGSKILNLLRLWPGALQQNLQQKYVQPFTKLPHRFPQWLYWFAFPPALSKFFFCLFPHMHSSICCNLVLSYFSHYNLSKMKFQNRFDLNFPSGMPGWMSNLLIMQHGVIYKFFWQHSQTSGMHVACRS